MAQVENAPVAMAIDQALIRGGIPDKGPLPAAENEVDTDTLEEIGFARRDMATKPIDDYGFAVHTDRVHKGSYQNDRFVGTDESTMIL
jgi:hypothetical protein